MSKGIDWISIKNEYINTNISQRKLAEKYGVSSNTLIKRANKESWTAAKEKRYNEIAERVQQKTSEKIIQDEVNRLDNILRLGDKLQTKIDEAVNQLTIHVDMFGKEHETNVIHVPNLKKLVSSLKELTEIINSAEANNSGLDKLDRLIDGITDAAKK